MSNLNYNFRTAFKEVKETIKYQRETDVDRFLKEIIAEINKDEDDEIYENMLEEILFLQTLESDGCDIDAHIKIPFPDEYDEEFPYHYICGCSLSNFAEACNMLDLLSKKLKSEDFSIKPYDGEKAIENGKSFILTDTPR